MKRPFRESEKLVIYGLTLDANLTDLALARKFGMKESTVSSIRRRLIDSRNIYFANVPSWNKMGCQLMVQLYGPTNPAVPKDVKDAAHLSFLDHTPEIFDSVSGEGFIMMSGVYRDFSDYLVTFDRYERYFSGVRTAERADLKAIYFPFGISKLRFTYNFAPGLHRIFDLDVPKPEPQSPEQYEVDCVDLSLVERRALVNLVEYPHSTDAQIAQLLGKSRQTVTNIRKRLEKKGMFTRVCVPLLFTWNIDLIAYVHLQFKPDLDPDVREELSRNDWIDLSWYSLERDSEAFATYIFKDYRDYLVEMQRMMKPLLEVGVLRTEPHISLVSTVAAKELRDGYFAANVRKLLNLGDR